MLRWVRRFINLVMTGMLIILLTLWIPTTQGYELYYVSSGSMEPAIHVGEAIFVKRCNLEDLKVSDIVTYSLNQGQTLVTHRVVWLDTENGVLQTKGDANEEKDGVFVEAEVLVGKVIVHIPKLGHLVCIISEWSGKLLIFAVFLWLLALQWILEQWTIPKRRRRLNNERV